MFRAVVWWVAVAAMLVAAACRAGDSAGSPSAGPSARSIPTATATAGPRCPSPLPRPAGSARESIESGGLTRSYVVHIPPRYDGAVAAPLLLLLHGYAGTAQFMEQYTGIDASADQRGYVALIPDGQGSPQFWNEAQAAGAADDVAFTRDLLAKVEGEVCVDPARVFVEGYSNGGGMAQVLACQIPDTFAAIGLVASTYGDCMPKLPVVAFHGTADPLLPFDGSATPVGGVGGTTPPVRMFLSEWAARLGCDRLPAISQPAAGVELSTFKNCPGGDGQALLYAVLGGGHTWPGATHPIDMLQGRTTQAISATGAMWDFFASHPKTEPVPGAP